MGCTAPKRRWRHHSWPAGMPLWTQRERRNPVGQNSEGGVGHCPWKRLMMQAECERRKERGGKGESGTKGAAGGRTAAWKERKRSGRGRDADWWRSKRKRGDASQPLKQRHNSIPTRVLVLLEWAYLKEQCRDAPSRIFVGDSGHKSSASQQPSSESQELNFMSQSGQVLWEPDSCKSQLWDPLTHRGYQDFRDV